MEIWYKIKTEFTIKKEKEKEKRTRVGIIFDGQLINRSAMI